MLSKGMRDKPIEISQGALDSQRIAEAFPAPSPKVGGGEGTATRRVRLSTEHCQRFFMNATSKLVNGLQAAHDWLIQLSNSISKLS